jgi:hypothetical protein
MSILRNEGQIPTGTVKTSKDKRKVYPAPKKSGIHAKQSPRFQAKCLETWSNGKEKRSFGLGTFQTGGKEDNVTMQKLALSAGSDKALLETLAKQALRNPVQMHKVLMEWLPYSRPYNQELSALFGLHNDRLITEL